MLVLYSARAAELGSHSTTEGLKARFQDAGRRNIDACVKILVAETPRFFGAFLFLLADHLDAVYDRSEQFEPKAT